MKRKVPHQSTQPAKRKALTPRFYLYWLGILIFAVAFTGMLLGDFNADIRPTGMELFFHISGAIAFCFALAEQTAVYVGHKQGRIPYEQAMRYAGFMERNGSWSAPLICLIFVAFGLMTVQREGVNTWDLAIGWLFVLGFGYAIVRFLVRLFRKK